MLRSSAAERGVSQATSSFLGVRLGAIRLIYRDVHYMALRASVPLRLLLFDGTRDDVAPNVLVETSEEVPIEGIKLLRPGTVHQGGPDAREEVLVEHGRVRADVDRRLCSSLGVARVKHLKRH